MTSLLQTIPNEPNTNVFIESTANGVGGWFYDFWKAAERGENEYIPLFFAWFDEPTYTKPFDTEEEKRQFIEEVNMVTYDKEGNEIHTEEYELMKEFNLTYEQLNWRRFAIANYCFGDIDMFHQEYPSTPEEAFIASGRPKFNIGALKQYRRQQESGERGS